MAITFENALGVLPSTLQFRATRAEVLAGNISNTDTPDYKAKDLNFDQVFQQQLKANDTALPEQQTSARHLTLPGSADMQAAVYERGQNPGVQAEPENGNNVDLGFEQAAFMRNRMEFETSFTFLNMKMKGIERAITGT